MHPCRAALTSWSVSGVVDFTNLVCLRVVLRIAALLRGGAVVWQVLFGGALHCFMGGCSASGFCLSQSVDYKI
jgi:hypothetical protein